MRHRDRNEIIAQILECYNRNKATQIKIMSDTYLTFYSAKEYLLLLLENGLVEYQEGERTFKTTEKGINFLSIYQNFSLTSL